MKKGCVACKTAETFGLSRKEMFEVAKSFLKADAESNTISELGAKLGLKEGDRCYGYTAFMFGRKTAAVDFRHARIHEMNEMLRELQCLGKVLLGLVSVGDKKCGVKKCQKKTNK